jgi:hypothetical protein
MLRARQGSKASITGDKIKGFQIGSQVSFHARLRANTLHIRLSLVSPTPLLL